jgi:glycosyltransferase involved in cell wall biosynthesis
MMEQGGINMQMNDKHFVSDDRIVISVITIVYNGENTIEKTIRSVLSQSYRSIEYIIIDGNSSDKTVEIIKRFESRINRWISEPDMGISDAFNKGFKYSTGDYITYLNSGDWYEPDAISNVVSFMKDKGAIYSGNVNLYTEDSKSFIKVHISRPERIFQTMRIAHPSTFVPRRVFEKIGSFSLDYKIAMDYDFMLRAILKGFNVVVMDMVTTNMVTGGNSSNPYKAVREELTIKNKNLGKNVKNVVWYFSYVSYLTITDLLINCRSLLMQFLVKIGVK